MKMYSLETGKKQNRNYQQKLETELGIMKPRILRSCNELVWSGTFFTNTMWKRISVLEKDLGRDQEEQTLGGHLVRRATSTWWKSYPQTLLMNLLGK